MYQECVNLKKKHNYLAYIGTADSYNPQPVIYCSHCKKMEPAVRFLQFYVNKNIEDDFNKELESLKGDRDYFIWEKRQQGKRYAYIWLPYSETPNYKILNKMRFRSRKGKPLMICPNCKADITEENLLRLERTKSWIDKNIVPNKCFINDDGKKITINIFSYLVFPVVDCGKIKYLEISIRLVFNNETKNVYALPPIMADSMKPLDKNHKRILNITYMSSVESFLPKQTLRLLQDSDVISAISNYICKSRDITKNTDEKKSFHDILYYFRYPNLSDDAREIIMTLCKGKGMKAASRQRRKRILQEIFLIQDSKDELLLEMKRKKIPDKKMVKKMCIENPFAIYIYRFLTKIGFKDYNIICSIMEESRSYWDILILIYTDLLLYENRGKDISRFLKEFVRNKKEPQAKRLLFSNPFKYPLIEDCATLYKTINNNLEGGEFPIKWTNLESMHDDMSRLLPRLNNKNRKIPYYTRELKLNASYEGYTIRLARDTYELIDCGECMGICVGGYGDIACNKQSVILFILENNRFVGCIELSGDGKCLMQAKAKFNNRIQGNRALVLRKWCKDKEINTDRCGDYLHIKDGDIDFSEDNTCNYNYSITSKLNDPDRANHGVPEQVEYEIISDTYEEHMIPEQDDNKILEEAIFMD